MASEDSPRLSPRSTIALQQDRSVLLRHRVVAEDDFARAAQDIFALLKVAQDRHPGHARGLEVTIEGHTGERAGFDEDFFEFQQEFMLGAVGRFLTWVDTPLTGKLGNPEPQNNDLADRLRVEGPAS